MQPRQVVRLVILVALLVAGAPDGWAQTTTGAIAGYVRTQHRVAIERATVQARSVATGRLTTAVTDASGRFRLDFLDPGEWLLVARLVDGQVSDSRRAFVQLQQTTQIELEIGLGLTEQVEVRAGAPLVDRRQAGGVVRVGAAKIDSLPLDGRSFTDLAALDSSVRQAAPGNFYGERGSVFVINGQSGRSNSFLVDGLDNNDLTSGTNLNSGFSQQVIQDFVLMTHQFSPEFGRASGGVLNIVTKKGGNEPHWGAFVSGISSSWNDPGAFIDSLADNGASDDTVSRFQTGFNVSGPLKKDRAFFFAAYEHKNADVVIPFTGVDRDGSEGGLLVAPVRDDSLFARFDFNLSDDKSWMVRLSADDRSDDGLNVQGVSTPEAGFGIEEQDFQLASTFTAVLAPGVISESRFLASTSDFRQLGNSSRPSVERPSGIFGGNPLNRQHRKEDVLQFVQNVTWQIESHQIKLGLDVLRSNTDLSARFNPNGSLIYNSDVPFEPGDCGSLNPFTVQQARNNGTYPLVPCPGLEGIDDDGDGLIDEPGNIESYPLVYTLVDGEPDTVFKDTRFALFAQDRFETPRRWVLDYGVRYEANTYELPRNAVIESAIPNGGASRDTDNIAPRFGATFSPGPESKWLFRGGAGLFYDKLVLAFPAVAAVTSGAEIKLAIVQGFALEIDENFIEENGTDAAEAVTIPELTLGFSTGTELETPHVKQFSLGFDRRIGERAALRVDFKRVDGYDLPLYKDLNPVNCVPDLDEPLNNPACIGIPGHPDPTTGSIAAIVTNGRSWYEAVDVNWRWTSGLSWLSAGYTWSDAEDMGPDPLKGGIALPPDSTNLRGERARADGDRRHRIVVAGDFPIAWAGLRGSAVAQYMSGIPFNVTTGSDDNVDGIKSDRPDGVARNTGEDTPLAVVNALRLDEGLAAVSGLDEPDFYQVDLRVYRRFALAKGRAETYVQIFNLFDRVNPGLVEGRVLARNFGETITLAGPPRTVEAGLKFDY